MARFEGPVLFPFIGTELGGSHISAFTLGRSLMEDYSVRCVVLALRGSLIAQEAARLGFEVESLDEKPAMRHNPVYDIWRLPRRLLLLRKFGPSAIIYCNDIGTLQSWMLPGKLLRLPLVLHHRSLNRPVLPNRLVMGRADAVIAISQECRKNVSYLGDEIVSTVVDPFTIGEPKDIPSIRQELLGGMDASKHRLIGFIGNFWHRKRPEFFLDVAKAVAQRDDRARFVVFGRDGELTVQQLKDYANTLGIESRVIFAGFRLPVENNVGAMDLLMLPAVREPFGRAPIEAMLLSVPYVATADAGHQEIWDRWKGGQVVPVSATAEQWADVVLDALDNPSRLVLSPERRVAVAEELSASTHAAAVLSIYRRVQKR